MPVDKLFDPVGASPLIIAIFAAALISLIAVLLLGLWYYHRPPVREMTLEPVRVSDRERWIQQIDDVVARHVDSADEQSRELHIELAAVLREILSERAGMNVRSWQPSHLREVRSFESAADAISSWEQPSFAPYAKGDVPKARERAVEAVLAW